MIDKTSYARELGSLGTIRVNDKRFRAAEAYLRRAVAIDANPTYRLNLASTLIRLGAVGEAEELISGVLDEHPNIAGAWSILGLSQIALEKYDNARDSYAMAVDLDPANAEYHIDLSASLMLLGEWRQGWSEYEHRVSLINHRHTLKPWDGDVTKHVMVSSEQGAGDIIQFSRYVPLLAERVRKVTFVVPPGMYSLFQGLSSCCSIVTTGTMQEVPDEEILLQSLPCYFGTTVDDVPPPCPGAFATGSVPPIMAPEDFRVGLCWAGNSGHLRDLFRSIPFEAVLPLAFDPDINLFSFQVGPRASDIATAGAQALVSDLSGQIEAKWSSAATFLKHMDAVVTCDTGIAHLSASLGVPTCLLIAAIPDWRWLVSTKDKSPWYPSMRIIRQKTLFSWGDEVIQAGKWLSTVRLSRNLHEPVFDAGRTPAPAG